MKKVIQFAAAAFALAISFQSHAAMSNEAFAAQVEKEMSTLGQDKAYEDKTKAYCRLLSPVRHDEEPKCIALILLTKDRMFGGGSKRLR